MRRTVQRLAFVLVGLGLLALPLASPADADIIIDFNIPPVIQVPNPLPTTQPVETVDIDGLVVTDADAGSGDLTISISFSDGTGSMPAASIGRFSWGGGANVVSDSLTGTLTEIATALSTLRYRPLPGYAGTVLMQVGINDNGHTGLGGPLTDTEQFAIFVHAKGDANVLVNSPPVNHVQNPAPDTIPGAPVAIEHSVTDVDVGLGTVEMELDVAHHNGALPALPAEQVGHLTWSQGTDVTSDSFTSTLINVNAALDTLVFTPAPGFSGQARVVFEVDDNANSGMNSDPAIANHQLADTDFIVIDVAAPGDPDTTVNSAPLNHLPSPAPDAHSGVPEPIAPLSVSDVDVGAGQMELEISVAHHNGGLPAANVGRFTWGAGTNVTSDVLVAPIDEVNAALSTFTFTPEPDFTGQARIVFEIDDRGNSSSFGVNEPNDILADTDFIVIDVTQPPALLRVTTTPALPAEIIVDGIPRDSWGLNWVELAPGPHEVCFGPVAGYGTPPCQDIVMQTGQTTEIDRTYSQNGYLRAITSPALPSTITVDGVARNDWGLWTEVEPGTYEVCFGAVEDFDVPTCRDVEVEAGQTATTTGTFTPNAAAPGPGGSFGYLRVTTNPAVGAMITIAGFPRDNWGLNWVKVPTGFHQICFGAVPNMVAPGCQIVQVTAGNITEVEGDYEALGFLRVMTSPSVPATITVEGEPANAFGVWTAKATGTYDVCFGPVEGFVAPPCQNNVAVTAPGTTEITGTYVPL